MLRDTREEDGTFVRMRQEDRSWWLKSAYFIEKYKALWTVGLIILGATGWQYVSPSKRFDVLAQNQAVGRAKTDSVKSMVDSVSGDVQDIKKTLRLLVVIQCLDRSRKELAYMQLDCSNVEQYMDPIIKRTK